MTTVLALPRYVAGADLAERMVAALVPEAVRGNDVELDARRLLSSSSSFARGCVEFLLVRGGARRLVVLGGPEHFRAYLSDAAREARLDPDRVVPDGSLTNAG